MPTTTFHKKVIYYCSDTEAFGVILGVAFLGNTWRSQRVTEEEYALYLEQRREEKAKKSLFSHHNLETL